MKNNVLFVCAAILIGVTAMFILKSAQADETPTAATTEVPADKNPILVIETNQGKIEIELWPNVAPKTTENILGLAKNGYYNGVIFHRVIKNFMVQGGDPTGTGMGGESLWGGSFEDEISNDVQFTKKGLLAMANAGPNTNGSQFFITVAETSWLNGRHTIFGEVISGYDVVEKISLMPTDDQDRPSEKQILKKVYVKE